MTPAEEEALDRKAIRRIKRVGKELTSALLADFLDRYHDKFGAADFPDDAATKEAIVATFIRDLIEEVSDAGGEIAVERRFQHIYYQICARHIGGENFVQNYRTPAYDLDPTYDDAERRLRAERELAWVRRLAEFS